jgi:hypothetical protein
MQHDYDLANASGAAFRSDANDALNAIVTLNSGATTPATTFARMFWADTTTGLLKIRNAANTDWVTVGLMASANLGLVPNLHGYISGCVQSHAADVDHDITLSAGFARDAANGAFLELTADITKQIDAAWAVGSSQGGMDTGSVGNSSWYYIWLIKRSDTGVVDALFSLSASSPTMPTSYDLKRLIGAVRTDASANILAFSAVEVAGGGLDVIWKDPPLDVNLAATLTTSRRLDVLSVPLLAGIVANVNVTSLDASENHLIYVCSPDANDEAPATTIGPGSTVLATIANGGRNNVRVRTNAAGQIASRAGITVDNYYVATLGYTWGRR